jgi:predicted porin
MIDPLYRTALQGRSHGLQTSDYHSGAGENLDGRATNTIRYDSPDFNGLKAVAHYTLDSSESGNEDEDAYGIGASYENGGILVFADYMNQDGTATATPATVDETAWKLGGKYSMGMFGVMGQYEDFEKGSNELNVWHIAGTATMGNSMLYLGFGKGDHDDLANSEYTAWTLAAMHSLSKRTQAYVGFSQVDCDSGAGANLSACRFDGSNVNGEIDQFSLGMKHKF